MKIAYPFGKYVLIKIIGNLEIEKPDLTLTFYTNSFSLNLQQNFLISFSNLENAVWDSKLRCSTFNIITDSVEQPPGEKENSWQLDSETATLFCCLVTTATL